MDLNLRGERALVTGSSSGLGEAIVKLLASEGAAVVVHGRDADERHVAAICKTIGADGGQAASPFADYISGAMIRVDGGLNRSIP